MKATRRGGLPFLLVPDSTTFTSRSLGISVDVLSNVVSNGNGKIFTDLYVAVTHRRIRLFQIAMVFNLYFWLP